MPPRSRGVLLAENECRGVDLAAERIADRDGHLPARHALAVDQLRHECLRQPKRGTVGAPATLLGDFLGEGDLGDLLPFERLPQRGIFDRHA